MEFKSEGRNVLVRTDIRSGWVVMCTVSADMLTPDSVAQDIAKQMSK